MSTIQTVLLIIALVGFFAGVIMLAGNAAAAVEKDRERDEHEDGLTL